MAESSFSTSFSSPYATPKRKRDDIVNEHRLSETSPTVNHSAKSIFSFEPPTLQQPVTRSNNDPVEDGNSSPRTKVAQKFKDMTLESVNGGGGGSGSGGGVRILEATNDFNQTSNHRRTDDPRYSPQLPVFDFAGDNRLSSAEGEMQLDDEDDNSTRKRFKLPDVEHGSDENNLEIGTGEKGETNANAAGPVARSSVQIDESGSLTLQSAADPTITNTSKSGGTGRLQKSYPSINRLSDSKSRSRKRTGTPPIASKRKPTSESSVAEEEQVVVDPIRAALTWHEDEITVYDPEDKDDDGTGINGIGFKPTAAVAYARAQKRRQQLVEYRKREEGEARAKRNQRRREQLGGGAELERKHSMIRVHFSEAEPTRVATT